MNSLTQTRLSLFPRINQTVPQGDPTAEDIKRLIAGEIPELEGIKSSELVEITNIIRRAYRQAAGTISREADPAAFERGCAEGKRRIKNLKTTLPAVIASGTCSSVGSEVPDMPSWMLVLDIDGLGQEELDSLKLMLKGDPYVAMAFTSPSGSGLKVFIRRSEGVLHSAAFERVRNYFVEKYEIEPDSSGKDVMRRCFLASDPEVYWNPSATEFPILPGSRTTNTSHAEPALTAERAEDRPSEELVRAALKFVRADERDTWLRMGFALHSWDPSETGFRVWDEWSRTCSEKYDEADQRRTWDRSMGKKEGVTIRTLFFEASAKGWIRPKPNSRKPEGGRADGLPIVVLPSGDVTNTEAAENLYGVIAPSNTLFRRDNAVVTLQRDQKGERRLDVLLPTSARSFFERYARFYINGKGANGEDVLRPKPMSEDAARCILECVSGRELLPPVNGLINCAVLLEVNGTLRTLGSGYDRETGLFIKSMREPESVPLEEAVCALAALLDDYDFVTGSDKSRAIADFLTPALKLSGLIGGAAPASVAEANESQSGKGYRFRTLCAIYNESPYVIAPRERGVGSFDESLGEAALSGLPFILLDNLRGRLDSKPLESMLTEAKIGARVPRLREVQVDTSRVLVLITSNGLESTPDLANRSNIVRITKRQGALFQDLVGRIKDRQSYYLGCVFSVVKEWHRRGKPRSRETRHSFQEWAQSLDWIVQNLFALPPLLDGHQSAQARTANPTLTFARNLGVEIERLKLLGEFLTAARLAEIADDAEISIPGLRFGEPDYENKAKLRIGKKLGGLFRDAETIEVDGFSIERQTSEVHRDSIEGGNYLAKHYRFTRGGAN